MKLQKTIKNERQLAGRAMFSGAEARVVFRPGRPSSGIVFVRTDLPEPVRIEAIAPNLIQRSRRTALTKGQVSVETIEHCLAAIYALEIDNIIVEVSGQELPAPDCSSAGYYRALQGAGVVQQQVARRVFTITEPVSFEDAGGSIYALPCKDGGLNISYELDYGGHTGIGRQLYSCLLSAENFGKNLAPARTFLLEAEARQLQSRGAGTHLSARELLVINSDGPVKNSFRFDNECVRHKVVDLIGDIALAGVAIEGRIVAYRSGHQLNHQLAKKLYTLAKRAERREKTGSDALIDIRQIAKVLPHRFPFLLVDKVVEIEDQRRIEGIKNITFNEPFFQGHFPGTPIMPGVLIVEALAQVSGLLFAQKLEHTGQLAVLLSMDNVKLRKAVVPGDQLVLISEAVKLRKRTAQCKCRAMVAGQIAAEADIKFMLVDDERI